MSSFAQAIQTAILLFPIVALFFTIPYILHQYHKYGSIHSWRTVVIYSFILYMMSAYFLVILPLPSQEYVSSLHRRAYNLQPFLVFQKIFTNTGLDLSDFSTYFPTLKNAVVYEAIFNVFLTVPFGVYLHYYFKCSFFKTFLFSFGLTLFFELTQLTGLYFIYPCSYRVFDVDDLILNTLGGCIGYFIGSLFLKFLPTREEMDEKSYQKGESVSFLRRMVSIGIDVSLIFLLTFFGGFLIYRMRLPKVLLGLPVLLYCFLILIFHRSVGMSFLKLKFESFRTSYLRWWHIFGYYFFFISEYVLFPVSFLALGYALHHLGYLSQVVFEYTVVVVFAFTLMVYVISFLKRLFHMRLVYELLSGVQLKSTIQFKKTLDDE